MRCLVNVEGGLGKHVMFTALTPILKEFYEEVYVVSAYYDVMQACSYVDQAFAFGMPNLYQDIVLDEDVEILWVEPYNHSGFIKKKCHLFDAWLDVMHITKATDNLDNRPIIDRVYDVFPQLRQEVEAQLNKMNNDFIVVQFCGGQSPLDPNMCKNQYNPTMEPLKRNYHQGQELINLLHEAYPSSTILHYALANEPAYQNSTKIEMTYLAWHEMVKNAKKVVVTDSSMQHIATSAQAPDITVIWGETRPEHFGYASNKNICAQHVKNTQPYFKPLGASPAIVKFPTPKEIMEVVG